MKNYKTLLEKANKLMSIRMKVRKSIEDNNVNSEDYKENGRYSKAFMKLTDGIKYEDLDKEIDKIQNGIISEYLIAPFAMPKDATKECIEKVQYYVNQALKAKAVANDFSSCWYLVDTLTNLRREMLEHVVMSHGLVKPEYYYMETAV